MGAIPLGQDGRLFEQRLRSGSLSCPYLLFHHNDLMSATEQVKVLRGQVLTTPTMDGILSVEQDENPMPDGV